MGVSALMVQEDLPLHAAVTMAVVLGALHVLLTWGCGEGIGGGAV